MAQDLHFVEEVIEIFTTDFVHGTRQGLDKWTLRFVLDISHWIAENRPLTTEQAKVILRILNKTSGFLISHDLVTAHSVDSLLRTPRYRNPLVASTNIPREVRYMGDNTLGFRFKMNTDIINQIKKLNHLPLSEGDITWDPALRLWLVPITRDTIDQVMNIISEHQFNFDDEVAAYLAKSKNSVGIASVFAYDEENNRFLANICDNEIIAKWIVHVLGGEPV